MCARAAVGWAVGSPRDGVVTAEAPAPSSGPPRGRDSHAMTRMDGWTDGRMMHQPPRHPLWVLFRPPGRSPTPTPTVSPSSCSRGLFLGSKPRPAADPP